jgi:hypothetical protein
MPRDPELDGGGAMPADPVLFAAPGSRVPHCPQNCSPASFRPPHDGHPTVMLAPHRAQ